MRSFGVWGALPHGGTKEFNMIHTPNDYTWAIFMWESGIPFKQVQLINQKLSDSEWFGFTLSWSSRYNTFKAYVGSNRTRNQYECESTSARRAVTTVLKMVERAEKPYAT